MECPPRPFGVRDPLLGGPAVSTVVEVSVSVVCSCESRQVVLLRTWIATLDALHPEVLRGLLSVGCSASCRIAAAFSLGGFVRWTLRPAPPIPSVLPADPARVRLLDPLLREAATVRLAGLEVVSPPRSIPSTSFFYPPLDCFGLFTERVEKPEDIGPACEVFAALVSDGMPVVDALSAAPDLL